MLKVSTRNVLSVTSIFKLRITESFKNIITKIKMWGKDARITFKSMA